MLFLIIFSIGDSGSSGSNTINFDIYDDGGNYVNTLFGSGANRCLISGANGSNVIVGQNLIDLSTRAINTAGHTIQYGVLNLTTIPAGYYLVPYVESFSISARSIRMNIRLREQ
jgi:hypothetical protein